MSELNNKNKPEYMNPKLPVEKRVADLMQRMTLEEKVDQLRAQLVMKIEDRDYTAGHVRDVTSYLHNPEKPLSTEKCAEILNNDQKKSLESSRLGIPVLINSEGLHGAVWGNATIFPQSIALASTWDEDTVHEVAAAIGRELRAVGVRQVLSPVINIARDSRWGRTQETFGEDTHLTSRIGAAYVKGIEENGVKSTLKHFANNFGDGGRDSNASNTSWRVLREVYFPAFKACIQEGGAGSVMAAYNSLDGVPCSCNKTLLTNILRNEWGFDGLVVSDYFSVVGIEFESPILGTMLLHGMNNAHRTARTPAEAQKLALLAGLDVELPNGGQHLLDMVKRGEIDEKFINQAVARVLKTKFELGLFENPFVDAEKADSVVCCREHLDLLLDAARKSIVLLKNDKNVLPLNKNIKTLGIFGPAAGIMSYGDYSPPEGGINVTNNTPIDGIRKILSSDTRIIVHEEGQDAAKLASGCDAAVFFAAVVECEGNDRSFLELPDEGVRLGAQANLKLGHQEEIIKAIAATGVPTIVVLVNGGAVAAHRWANDVDGIVEAWYGGMFQGTAIAEVLFGDYNPGGKLPLTFPKSTSQVPLYYNYKPSGRSYEYCDIDSEPQFYFGHGLSYTTFKYENLVIEDEKITASGEVAISLDITNTGTRSGDEVVQLYLRDEFGSVVTPLKQLKGFRRISLPAGEKQTVTFRLKTEDLALWDQDMNSIVEPGTFKVMAGSSSNDIRLEGSFEVLG